MESLKDLYQRKDSKFLLYSKNLINQRTHSIPSSRIHPTPTPPLPNPLSQISKSRKVGQMSYEAEMPE